MSAESDIANAVDSAIRQGMSAKQFMQSAWEAWEESLALKARMDGDDFRKAVRGQP